MITNLPKTFPLQRLNDFVFGDLEAQRDELLQNDICICRIQPVQEFLEGRKSIVVGDRGAGKTAIFKLLCDGKLKFRQNAGIVDELLPISEELQYHSIRTQVMQRLDIAAGEDPIQKLRIAWEVFLLYRVLSHVSATHGDYLSQDLHDTHTALQSTFNPQPQDRKSFRDLLFSQKYTIGTKIDGASGSITPYASVEPKQADQTPHKLRLNLDITEVKASLNRCLKNAGIRVIILLDRLDEFEIGKEYEAQREVLQALLHCERSYLSCPYLQLKLFLRKDLFSRLNFETLGYDKIDGRTVHLLWQDSDIREVIARRIAFNYIQCLGIQHLLLMINEQSLCVDGSAPSPQSSEPSVIDRFLHRRRDAAKREGRRVNFNDEISREIITSIFPRTVRHTASSGKEEGMGLFDYLGTHFCSGHGHVTPRVAISFLEICLAKTKEYYRQNPDLNQADVGLDDNGEYPLIQVTAVVASYRALQVKMLETLSSINKKWEKWLKTVWCKKGRKSVLSFATVSQYVGSNNPQELGQFLAFISHIGFVNCKNPEAHVTKRRYELPVLFQTIEVV